MATKEERWRCFVAVPIGDELRASLAEYVAELRQLPWAGEWRWTDPAGWHITLAFLGPIPPASVPNIAASLNAVAARHAPFTPSLSGLGTFPSMRRARILLMGIDDPEGRLADLAADLRSVFRVDEDSPFRGHITIGRNRPNRAMRVVPPDLPSPRAMWLKIGSVALVRSRLGQAARAYETLDQSDLDARGS